MKMKTRKRKMKMKKKQNQTEWALFRLSLIFHILNTPAHSSKPTRVT